MAGKKRLGWLHWPGGAAVFISAIIFMTTSLIQAQTATPTRDRLAAPPTVPAPTQADEGAQIYWLNCQPCHGDVGQGLTNAPDDDWRAQYPPEDQNCWNSGCHGKRPYENGFILPTQVPSIIGGESLHKFETMAQVHAFIKAGMPMQAPGSLTDEEYLALAAFLARENGLWDGTSFTDENLAAIRLQPLPPDAPATPAPTALAGNEAAEQTPVMLWVMLLWVVGSIGVMLAVILGGVLWQRRKQ